MQGLVRLALLLVVLLQSFGACAQSVARMEPPFWYQGFKQTSVQVMFYGERLATLTPRVTQPGVSVQRVETVENPNYLFVYLDISPSVEPGDIGIDLVGADTVIHQQLPLHAKNPDASHTAGFGPRDAIYLITPDRFANGDEQNDDIEGYGDAVDRDALCGRHGGDLRGISDHLPYIRELGFTAIWLNPVLENRMPVCSYHGYSTTDFYAVDPRYGSNSDYQELAIEARAMGIGLIMDMIVNHIGSGHWWMADLPSSNWLNFADTRPITNHIHASTFDPNASSYDRQMYNDGWFVDTMPDLNQRQPLLADYLVQNALWWIEYLGLSGIRMDTHPYPDKEFMARWSSDVMREYPNFNIVGEEWHSSPAFVSYWQRGKLNHDGYVSDMPSMMDFPVQEALRESLNASRPERGSSWMSIYETLAHDFLYPDASNLTIFPDNHDMSRIFTQLGEDRALFDMAMVFYATMRGAPQFYYGTEILMANRESDDHGLIRSDFPGGWASDTSNARTGEGLSESALEAQTMLRKLLVWRQDHTAIHEGRLMQFAPDGEAWVYFRYTEDETVMVVLNKNENPTELNLDRYDERIRGAKSAIDVLKDEKVDLGETLSLKPRSALVLSVEH